LQKAFHSFKSNFRLQNEDFQLVVKLLSKCKSRVVSKDSVNLNPLSTNDTYIRHETFSFMMSFPAMSFGDRFCFSRKGGIGGGGWVHPKGANSMVMSGLVSRSDLVGTGRAISVLFGINGVRNK